MKKSVRKQWILAALVTTWVLPTVYAADDVVDTKQQLGEYVVTSEKQKDDNYLGGQISAVNRIGMLGNRDFTDTPFNVTGYTDKLIEQQQATTVSDVLGNDASIIQENWGTSGKEQWKMRGFDIGTNDISFNGLFGIGPNVRGSIDNVARVEVFKGPSAMLSGMSGTGNVGGSINFVPKRGEVNQKQKVTIGFKDGAYREAIDVGGRFGQNHEFGLRLNASATNGNTYRAGEQLNNKVAAIGFDYKRDKLTIGVDAGYARNRADNPSGTWRFTNVLRAAQVPGADLSLMKAKNYYKHMNFVNPGTYYDVDEKYAALRTEYDFSKNLSGWAAFGVRNTKQDSITSTFDLMSLNGTVRILHRADVSKNTTQSQDVGLRGKFVTGDFKHELSASFSNLNSVTYQAVEVGLFQIRSQT